MSDNMAIQNNLHFIKEDINRLNQKNEMFKTHCKAAFFFADNG